MGADEVLPCMPQLIEDEYSYSVALTGAVTCFAPVKQAMKDQTHLLALLSKQRGQAD